MSYFDKSFKKRDFGRRIRNAILNSTKKFKSDNCKIDIDPGLLHLTLKKSIHVDKDDEACMIFKPSLLRGTITGIDNVKKRVYTAWSYEDGYPLPSYNTAKENEHLYIYQSKLYINNECIILTKDVVFRLRCCLYEDSDDIVVNIIRDISKIKNRNILCSYHPLDDSFYIYGITEEEILNKVETYKALNQLCTTLKTEDM